MPVVGLLLVIAVALPFSLPAIDGDHGAAAVDQSGDSPGPHLVAPPALVTLAIALWLFVALTLVSMGAPAGVLAARRSRLRAPPQLLEV